MKVGVFHPAMNFYGGAELVALVVTNALARNGYDVQLFVNEGFDQKRAENIFGEKVYKSVKIISKPTFSQPRGIKDFYQSPFQTLALKAKCDILVDTYSNFVFPWVDVCYLHFPVISRYSYNRKFPYVKNSNLVPVALLPNVFLEKSITQYFTPYNTKLLLANSQFTAQAFNDFSDSKIHVLYPPVPSTFFHNKQTTHQKSRENLVVTISRFDKFKGLEKIPFIAKHTNKKVCFIIMGMPQDKKLIQFINRTIKKLDLTKRVKLLTGVSRQEMKAVLGRAKIYLHTTVAEHFGISIVEAMAMGCIPIVHDSGGVKEYVPADYRYEHIRDAAQKINKNVCDWSSTKAQELTGIAEKFKQENFSREFMKLFKLYEMSKYA